MKETTHYMKKTENERGRETISREDPQWECGDGKVMSKANDR